MFKLHKFSDNDMSELSCTDKTSRFPRFAIDSGKLSNWLELKFNSSKLDRLPIDSGKDVN